MLQGWLTVSAVLFGLALALCILVCDGATEYYVRPTDSLTSTCQGGPCLTLAEYVEQQSEYFTSDVTLKFLPGIHKMNESVSVYGVSNLSLEGLNVFATADEPDTMIDCSPEFSTGGVGFSTGGTGFSFQDAFNVSISGLAFIECVHLPVGATLIFQNVSYMNITRVAILNPFNNAMSLTNVLGHSAITHCLFHYNLSRSDAESHRFFSHVYIRYTEEAANLTANILSITNCTFSNGGGSLTLFFSNSDYGIDINIQNMLTTGSTYADIVISSGIFQSTQLQGPSRLTIRDSIMTSGSERAIFWLTYGDNSNLDLHIFNSHITGYHSGALVLYFYNDVEGIRIVLQKCNISFNDGSVEYAPAFLIRHLPNALQSTITFQNVSFLFNGYSVIEPSQVPAIGILLFSHNVTFSDCTFSGNRGTSISAISSSFNVSGTTHFINNTGYRGAGLAFDRESFMTVNNTNILFQDNFVSNVGGAVFVEGRLEVLSVAHDINNLPTCFFQLPGISDAIDHHRITFHFVNNTAVNGGNDIYGAAFDQCNADITSIIDVPSGTRFLSSIFHFQSSGSVTSQIASDPTRVCLCTNGLPDCTLVIASQTYFPGEVFVISAAVVGDRFGTVNGTVYAQFLPQNGIGSSASLGELQQSQGVGHSDCTSLRYSVQSARNMETLVLTATTITVQNFVNSITLREALLHYYSQQRINTDLLSFPVYITITLHPCPLGFVLSGQPGKCDCDPQLQKNNIPCNITLQTVQRSSTVWVNASFDGNISIGVIVHNFCPLGYCKPDTVNVDLEDPNSQCAFNHSGILCGGCQTGLSLALGSAQCLPCPNSYLALLIPFAVAGFALVVFLKVLNLTVSVGTINGLVFYANIVSANYAFFFPPGTVNFLTVFISWINLDLGFETCFFDGLNSYGKVWLQFVFPIYVWTIAGLMIVFAHYTSVGVKVIGSNSVQVLATLFLLSYTKLLRTIISVLSFTELVFPDGSHTLVWQFDGNVPYLGKQHTPLFIVALLFLLFISLPLTGVLFFGQFLQRFTKYRTRRLVLRLKPFFDAYFGPFKDRHRYWVGALLLIRGILYVIFAAYTNSVSNSNSLVITVTVLALLSYTILVGSTYRKWYLSALETAFILNLGILAGGTLYVQLSKGDQAALVYTSTSISVAMFIGIIIWHVYKRLQDYKLVIKIKSIAVKSRQNAKSVQSTNSATSSLIGLSDSEVPRPHLVQEIPHRAINFSELREPLLAEEEN